MPLYKCRECRESVHIDGELGVDTRTRRAWVLCRRCCAKEGFITSADDAREMIGELLSVVPLDRLIAELAQVCAERHETNAQASHLEARDAYGDGFVELTRLQKRLHPYA